MQTGLTVHLQTGNLEGIQALERQGGSQRGCFPYMFWNNNNNELNAVNCRFRVVFASWDHHLAHQIHPQTPIHTSLARSDTAGW